MRHWVATIVRRGRRSLLQDRGERGASLVEFALILPVFSLLLFGLIDFGLVFGGFITLENQVNGAARAIAVGRVISSTSSSWPSGCSSTTPDLCTAVADIGSSQLGVVPGTVEVEVKYPTDGTETQGSPVVVCAQAQIKSTTGITSPILNGRTIHASSKVLLEVDAVDQGLTADTPYVSYPTGTNLTWCQ